MEPLDQQASENDDVLMTDLINANSLDLDSDAAELADAVAALRASDAQQLVKGRRLQNIVADLFSLSDSPGDAEITAIAFLTSQSKASIVAAFNRPRTILQGVLKAAKHKVVQQKQQQTTPPNTASMPSIAAAPKPGGPTQRPSLQSAVIDTTPSSTLQNHPEAWQKQQDRLGICLDLDGSIGQAPHLSGMFIKAIQVRGCRANNTVHNNSQCSDV